MDFGAPNRHFRVQKIKCPFTFLKISIRALHFWIKSRIFIQLIRFLILHNIEGVPNWIFKKSRKRSSKRSSYISSKFELFEIGSKFWTFWNWFHLPTDWQYRAPFWSSDFLKFEKYAMSAFTGDKKLKS